MIANTLFNWGWVASYQPNPFDMSGSVGRVLTETNRNYNRTVTGFRYIDNRTTTELSWVGNRNLTELHPVSMRIGNRKTKESDRVRTRFDTPKGKQPYMGGG